MNIRSPLCPSICTAAVAPASGTANARLASSAILWMSPDGLDRRRSHLTRHIRWGALHPPGSSRANGVCTQAIWPPRRSAGRHVDLLGLLLLRPEQLHAQPVARI